ncbi:MAG: CoA pyrophosphatase [Candidatus Neomarinimicrobiota bacterium]|nr:MAG: CoA pyrophosphatase [Candidatus Neomarinimicrobiota bacterium]
MNFQDFSQKLQIRLEQPLPGRDIQLAMMARPSRPPDWFRRKDFVPAAVLFLLFPRNDDVYFLLTQRTERVQHHKGQVSLPGGAREPDENLADTALRETREELGIDPQTVSILGQLTPLPVPVTGFMVYPFMAFTSTPPTLSPAPEEVARVFSVPLAELLDDSRIHHETRSFDGIDYRVPYFQFSGVKVWGATSMILAEAKQILQECR